MTDKDPFLDPGWLEYVKHVRDELVPMIDASAVSLLMAPDPRKTDVKFATELGFSVMLDKPIIAIVSPGTKASAKLMKIADEIVEGQPGDPSFDERLTQAVKRMRKKAK